MTSEEVSNAFFGFSLRLGTELEEGCSPPPPPPPSMSWKIQTASGARVSHVLGLWEFDGASATVVIIEFAFVIL